MARIAKTNANDAITDDAGNELLPFADWTLEIQVVEQSGYIRLSLFDAHAPESLAVLITKPIRPGGPAIEIDPDWDEDDDDLPWRPLVDGDLMYGLANDCLSMCASPATEWWLLNKTLARAIVAHLEANGARLASGGLTARQLASIQVAGDAKGIRAASPLIARSIAPNRSPRGQGGRSAGGPSQISIQPLANALVNLKQNIAQAAQPPAQPSRGGNSKASAPTPPASGGALRPGGPAPRRPAHHKHKTWF
jgi:hypothetical protein